MIGTRFLFLLCKNRTRPTFFRNWENPSFLIQLQVIILSMFVKVSGTMRSPLAKYNQGWIGKPFSIQLRPQPPLKPLVIWSGKLIISTPVPRGSIILDWIICWIMVSIRITELWVGPLDSMVNLMYVYDPLLVMTPPTPTEMDLTMMMDGSVGP